ncbi:unnamed protein product [Auanema sp. JU1783]|nr:unnamed protein product [Auanema sp. JU1783]
MIVDLVSATQREDWEQTRQLLYRHWITECPKLFNPSPEQPWESVSESVISPSLFLPIAGALRVDSQVNNTSLVSLNAEAGISDDSSKAGKICGHVFKVGELTYMCKNCATDPTCVMCRECFMRSEHKDHKYKIRASSGHGYCDCGDPDAWKKGYACAAHAPRTNSEHQDYVIPQNLQSRLTELFSIILQYCNSLVCWDEGETLPFFLRKIEEEIAPANPSYMTVLYNDETHTYENVIRALELFINCTKEQAMLIATIVDREGRSAVKIGSRPECERIRTEIQRRTSRDTNRRTEKNGPLDVKIMETALVAHQANAINLMAWTNQQLELCPFLSELIGDVLLKVNALDHQESLMEVDGVQNETLLVRFLRYNRRMWKAARTNIHQMLMKTVLMNPAQKYEFAKTFLKHYEVMYMDFVDDDHDLLVSIVSLSVQFLTVPGISKRLIAEENALSVMLEALKQHSSKYIKTLEGKTQQMFDFTNRSFPAVLKRAMNMTRDLVYILNSLPQESEWTEGLESNFISGFTKLLEFLDYMQGMDEVKRLSSEHQLWELEWETAFNIQLRIQEVLGLFIDWTTSNRTVHLKLLALCLDAMRKHPVTSSDSNETHMVIDQTSICKSFDVLHGSVSIHQPLWRLAAGLFAVGGGTLNFFAEGYEVRDPLENEILQFVKSMRQDIYENCLRVSVLCAQTNAQLWRRNGFSLINQIHNYYSPLCRTEMFDRDLQMLQVGAALFKPSDFVLHLITRFRLTEWADINLDLSGKAQSPIKLEPEENSKVIVSLAEDMLNLLIQICGERYKPGLGKCTLRDLLKREVVHVLCMDAHAFSKIVKKMPTDPQLDKVSLHDVVNEVAEFRKPMLTSAGQFYLKEEYLRDYNPFFYHYSKSDISQAELHQHKVRSKMDRSLKACPPSIPCEFEHFFAPIIELLRCKTVIRVCKVVIDRCLKCHRFSSDRLLHRALFLIGMGLQEQERSTNNSFDYVSQANEEGLLQLLEKVHDAHFSQTHHDLVWWTMTKFKQIENKLKDCETPEVPKESEKEEAAPSSASRAAKGAKYREMARQRMMKLQSSFLNSMQTETSKTDAAPPAGETAATATALNNRIDEDEDFPICATDSGFPVCLGAKRTKVVHVEPRKLTCILCQEDDISSPDQNRPFVCAAYVQRSQLFSQKNAEEPSAKSLKNFFVSAGLQHGIDASTCSHTMHFECFTNLLDNLLGKERQRPRQPLHFPQRLVDIETGEYLCPLCKRLSNCAMPILPSHFVMNVPGFSSARADVEDTFETWYSKVKGILNSHGKQSPSLKRKSHNRKRSHSERSLLDLAKQGHAFFDSPRDIALSNSVSSASAMSLLMDSEEQAEKSGEASSSSQYMDFQDMTELQSEFLAAVESTRRERKDPKFASSFANILRSVPGLALIMRNNKIVGTSYERYNDVIRAFCKALTKNVDDKNKELFDDRMRGYLFATTVWQSTAHVLRSASSNLKTENKPLFGALNTRQRDCITAMGRLSAAMSHSLQHMQQHTILGLKALLGRPPVNAPSLPTSPASPEICATSPPSSLPTSPVATTSPESSVQKLSGPLLEFLFNTHTKASSPSASVNLLHIDILSLAISLSMCIGWTWNNGVQFSSASRKDCEMIPDGSADEQYCIRLCLLGHYFQVFATFEDTESKTEVSSDPVFEERVKQLWLAGRPFDTPLVNANVLCARLKEATFIMLRPIALLYHVITMVEPPEALKDPSLDEFEPLCRYLGLPTSMIDLMSGSVIEELFDMWSLAIPHPFERGTLARQPIHPNMLIDLPEDFSEVIQWATSFRCPTVPFDESASNIPTLCLICGTILCAQSYCCQKQVGKESAGACRFHTEKCSGPMGIFLKIRDCTVFLLTSRARGCFRPAPYVDEFGETDQGFRRGNPLRLNAQLYKKLCRLWLTQGISEEIVNQYEIDPRNHQYDWSHF